ncbi:MAG TPA: hypothetical protein VKZ60_09470 [Chloroflexota bacterium]|nr:hypothetical protein [Chloroflexota bacterium]
MSDHRPPLTPESLAVLTRQAGLELAAAELAELLPAAAAAIAALDAFARLPLAEAEPAAYFLLGPERGA